MKAAIVELGLHAKGYAAGPSARCAGAAGIGGLYIHYAALENCPVVLLEAARAGLPVAARRAAGRELLESSAASRCIRPYDRRRSIATLLRC